MGDADQVSVQPLSAEEILSSVRAEASQGSMFSTVVDRPDDLQYDLGNVLATDVVPVDPVAFEAAPEEHLAQRVREDTQLLVNRIFALPMESDPDGVYATLPAPTTVVPREKPLPKPKPMTKWEKFAKEKGIKKRKKRGQMIWDEVEKAWKPRHGFRRANDEMAAPVLENTSAVPEGSDPWAVRKEAKRKRVEKNELHRRKNVARAEKTGTTALPSTIALGAEKTKPHVRKDKAALEHAIRGAQSSTASVGKFDAEVVGEPDRKRGRRNQARAEYRSALPDASEKERALQLLQKITSASHSSEAAGSSGKAIRFEEVARSSTGRTKKKGADGKYNREGAFAHKRGLKSERSARRAARRGDRD